VNDPEVLSVLRSIDRRLALLTGKEERDMRRALLDEVLTTPARVAMWDAIDGKIGSPELSKLAKVSDRAAQLFVKDLLDAGLVRPVTGVRGTVAEKDEDAIVRWYVGRVATAASA
jgi:hypothetical protein